MSELSGNPEQVPYAPTFDRWLAEVKAEAWAEGASAGCMCSVAEPPNPYRQAERLAAFEKATPEDYTQGEEQNE